MSEVGATGTSSARARRYLLAALVVAILFSIGFDYFGRPPLDIESMRNEHQLLEPDVVSYRLGEARWGAATVTYPITFATSTQVCGGSITLRWQPFGWQAAEATYTCPPS